MRLLEHAVRSDALLVAMALCVPGWWLVGCRSSTTPGTHGDAKVFEQRDTKLRPHGSPRLQVVFINDVPVPAASASAAASAMMRPPPSPPSSSVRSPEAAGRLRLEWRVPSSWKSVRPSSAMRIRQYEISVEGDEKPLELAVYYFGPKGAGGLDETFQRWVAAFGKDAPAKRTHWKGEGVEVHTVQSAGMYRGEVMGGEKMGKDNGADGWMLLGAYVASPEGPYYFKLLGPAGLVRRVEPDFERVLRSVRFVGKSGEGTESAAAAPAQ